MCSSDLAIALDFLAARRPEQRRPVRWLTSELPRITPAQRLTGTNGTHPARVAGHRPGPPPRAQS